MIKKNFKKQKEVFQNCIKIFFIILFTIEFATSMGSPDTTYCEKMGYKFLIESNLDGSEIGFCEVGENKFNSWDFFLGKVGQEYSYCMKNGYEIKTLEMKNPFAQECAVCINGEDKTPMYKMMNLFGDYKMEYIEEIPEISEEEKARSLYSINERSSQNYVSEFPSYFDWRNAEYDGIKGNWMTPVKQQLCGDCTSFAVVGVIEAKMKIESKNIYENPDLSEQHLLCDGVVACTKGGRAINNFYYIQKNGIVDEACLLYAAEKSNCIFCDDYLERLNKFSEFNVTGLNSDGTSWYDFDRQRNRERVKKALIEKGPLQTDMYYDLENGFFDENNIYKSEGKLKGANHAVIIVGYNDTGDIHTSYWIIKNSWGSWWNYKDEGYFKVGWDRWLEGYGYIDQGGMGGSNPIYVRINECLPSGPELIGSSEVQEFENSSKAYYDKIQIKSGYAFVSTFFDGLHVFDIRKDKPEFVYKYTNFSSHIFDIYIEGDYLYMVDEDLKIINISNPLEPELVGKKYVYGGQEIFVKDNYIYQLSPYGGIIIIDALDKKNPKIVSQFNPFNSSRKDKKYPILREIFVSGNYTYVVVGTDATQEYDPSGLYIIDISNPENPTLESLFKLPCDRSDYSDVFVEGNYAYLTAMCKGYNYLYVIDISESSNPKEVFKLSTDSDKESIRANEVFVKNGFAYVGGNKIASQNGGLYVFDLRDLESLIENPHIYPTSVVVGFYELPEESIEDLTSIPTLMLEKEVNIYATNGKEGIKVFSIWRDCLLKNVYSIEPEEKIKANIDNELIEVEGILEEDYQEEDSVKRVKESVKVIEEPISYNEISEKNSKIDENSIYLLSENREEKLMDKIINFLKNILKFEF